MKFKVTAVVLVMALILSVTGAYAATDYTSEADKLYALGLFRGTNTGYELSRAPNRAESAAMLLKLLGVEEAAKKANYAHPFTDVPTWASPFVGYMFKHGMTTGIGNQKFGASNLTQANEYMTFVLKALGYTNQDFNWQAALKFAADQGIITPADAASLSAQTFNRNEMVHVSYVALNAKIKATHITLAERLIDDAAISGRVAFEQKVVHPQMVVPVVVKKVESRLVIDYLFSKLDETVIEDSYNISITGAWEEPLNQSDFFRRIFLTDSDLEDRMKHLPNFNDFNNNGYAAYGFSSVCFYSKEGELKYYAMVPKNLAPGSYNLILHTVSSAEQEILRRHQEAFRDYLKVSLPKVSPIPSEAMKVVQGTATTPSGSITKNFLSIDHSKLPGTSKDFKYYTISGAWTDHFVDAVTLYFAGAYKVHGMNAPKTEYHGTGDLEINGGGFLGLELYDAAGALVGYGVFDTDRK